MGLFSFPMSVVLLSDLLGGRWWSVPEQLGQFLQRDDREQLLGEPRFLVEVAAKLLASLHVGDDPDHRREDPCALLLGTGEPVVLVRPAGRDYSFRVFRCPVDLEEVAVTELRALDCEVQVWFEGQHLPVMAEVLAPAAWLSGDCCRDAGVGVGGFSDDYACLCDGEQVF